MPLPGSSGGDARDSDEDRHVAAPSPDDNGSRDDDAKAEARKGSAGEERADTDRDGGPVKHDGSTRKAAEAEPAEPPAGDEEPVPAPPAKDSADVPSKRDKGDKKERSSGRERDLSDKKERSSKRRSSRSPVAEKEKERRREKDRDDGGKDRKDREKEREKDKSAPSKSSRRSRSDSRDRRKSSRRSRWLSEGCGGC
jgi:ATP-dependent RNA helicase DDX46/PRP5